MIQRTDIARESTDKSETTDIEKNPSPTIPPYNIKPQIFPSPQIFIREAEKLKPKIGPIGRKLLAEMLLQLTNALVVSEKLLQHTKGSKGQLSDLTKHYPTKLAECIKTLAHVVAAKTDAGAPPSHGDVSVKVAAEMTAICQSQNRNMFTLFEAVGNAVISLGTPSSGGTPSTSCKQAITDAVSSWTAHNKTRWGAEFLKICAERCPEQVVESLEWEGVLGSAKRRHVTMELWQLLDKLFRRREVVGIFGRFFGGRACAELDAAGKKKWKNCLLN